MSHIEYLKENRDFNAMSIDEIFNEVLDSYMGTCEGMADEDLDWLDENGQLTNWDSFIFKCNCGWFCDVAERHENSDGGEDYCDDCKPESD